MQGLGGFLVPEDIWPCSCSFQQLFQQAFSNKQSLTLGLFLFPMLIMAFLFPRLSLLAISYFFRPLFHAFIAFTLGSLIIHIFVHMLFDRSLPSDRCNLTLVDTWPETLTFRIFLGNPSQGTVLHARMQSMIDCCQMSLVLGRAHDRQPFYGSLIVILEPSKIF
ncbi:hypothetical protein O6H91_03G100900 [Diphasiastrum complanatum]|uniref:Uncharacterized protein n=1 Tax=Diphasiastrum complanatum TaxID=34168 RepID=A0ACC2EA43_DIPCM|nr:hypothetical protein O6H91_03G100900 [Diphasiastrum complanatum]